MWSFREENKRKKVKKEKKRFSYNGFSKVGEQYIVQLAS